MNKKKVLFVATVPGHINAFHLPFLKSFKERGYEVHVASNRNDDIEYCDKKIIIPISRSPYKATNFKAIKKLKKIIDKENYEIIHCHTPMGGVVARIAAKKARKKGTKIIYTAHGFHFYKGAPLKNWLFFYPIEKILSKHTDILITINQEDYNLALKKFKKANIKYVPGVGINPEKFNIQLDEKEKNKLKKDLGLQKDDYIMIYTARLDKNKNQIFLINAMEELIKTNKNIHLLLVGGDELNGYYQNIAKEKKLDKNIHFLGFRKDIPNLLKISNIAVSSSLREGLPVNIMEALCCNLPVVALKCRGMEDLIENGENGFIINNNDIHEFTLKIHEIMNNKYEFKNNIKNKQYEIRNIIKIMDKLYFNKE